MKDRPRPPRGLTEPTATPLFAPAEDLRAWMMETFIDAEGPLANPDHDHLVGAHIGVLWTNEEARRHGRWIMAQAEVPNFRGSPWAKARQEAQLAAWFGGEPDFLLTFYAPFAAEVDHATWCALVEHELYHCGQETDRDGIPKWHRDGSPRYGIRGHDVEEFIGVVRRYGAGASGRETRALVEAGKRAPEVAEAQLVEACGVCLKAAA